MSSLLSPSEAVIEIFPQLEDVIKNVNAAAKSHQRKDRTVTICDSLFSSTLFTSSGTVFFLALPQGKNDHAR